MKSNWINNEQYYKIITHTHAHTLTHTYVHIFVCALYNNMTNFFHNKRKSCTIKRKQQKALTDPTVHPPISLFPLPPFPSLYLSHSLSLSLSVCLRVDVSTWDAWVLHVARERPLPSSIRSNRALSLRALSHTHTHELYFLALQSIIELWLWKLEQDPNFFTA